MVIFSIASSSARCPTRAVGTCGAGARGGQRAQEICMPSSRRANAIAILVRNDFAIVGCSACDGSMRWKSIWCVSNCSAASCSGNQNAREFCARLYIGIWGTLFSEEEMFQPCRLRKDDRSLYRAFDPSGEIREGSTIVLEATVILRDSEVTTCAGTVIWRYIWVFRIGTKLIHANTGIRTSEGRSSGRSVGVRRIRTMRPRKPPPVVHLAGGCSLEGAVVTLGQVGNSSARFGSRGGSRRLGCGNDAARACLSP